MNNYNSLPDKKSCNYSHLPVCNTDSKVNIMNHWRIPRYFRFVTNASNPISPQHAVKYVSVVMTVTFVENQLRTYAF